MRKLGFIIGIIVLLMVLMPLSMPVSNSLPAEAAGPVPTEAPSLPPPQEPPPVIDGHGTGFIPPTMDLSYITGQRMPDGSLVGASPPVGVPPASFDWRTLPNGTSKVTSVKDQLACGACYAFAGIGNVESKVLIDTNTTPPGPDYSENNAKECNWREINNWVDGFGNPWGSCDGGNYYILASLFSQKGIVDETNDPYVPANTTCNSSCPYNKTLLDWRIISGNVVPNTTVLQNYTMTYGPVYTTLFVDPSHGFNGSYTGSYTFNYTAYDSPNHAVLIVGWSDTLPPDQVTGLPGKGWIVKNSWGPTWGAGGYFYIAYGAADIGKYSSFMYNWQNYDNNGSIMYYDEDCWDASWGYSSTTGWGLCNFTPTNNTNATRVEFWTTAATSDIDIYIYDNFNGTSLSDLLVSQCNYSFVEPGYHSVPLNSPLPLTAGDPVIVVVKFTDVGYTYPIPIDPNGPYETGRTYVSPSGLNGTWTDLGTYAHYDVAIRLRTSGVVGEGEWYWKPGNWTDYAPSGMPDFDQKQDNWTDNVTGNWTYCGPVAVANSLWWFDSKNEPSPQPPSTINDHYYLVTNFSNPWDDHNASNVMPLVCNLAALMNTSSSGTNVTEMQAGINQYLNNTTYAADYSETTVLRPEFGWIEEEVERCQDVVLLLGFYQHHYGEDYWWRVGGHYVTVAGVNSNTSQLGISDPYFDNAEAGGPGVVPVAHAYPHNATVHNDTQYVSHDIYNVVQLMPGPGPVGFPCWALQNYANGTPIVNFLGQNSGPLLMPPTPGLYDPDLVNYPVVAVIDYAVDVSQTTGTLEGHVTFAGRGAAPSDRWIEEFEVKGFESGNLSHVLWTTNATTNNTGGFTITGLTPGTYDIGIKNATCLSELVTNVTLTAGVTTVANFGNREGDVKKSDKVDGFDFSQLSTAYNTKSGDLKWNPNADLNRSGKVDGFDFSLLSANYNVKGGAYGYF